MKNEYWQCPFVALEISWTKSTKNEKSLTLFQVTELFNIRTV